MQGGETVHVLLFSATSLSTAQIAMSTEDEDARGLVLRQTAVMGVFRRIRLYTCSTKIYDNDLVHQEMDEKTVWNKFAGLLHQQGTSTAKEICSETIDDQEGGTGGFVIIIV